MKCLYNVNLNAYSYKDKTLNINEKKDTSFNSIYLS